MFKRAISLQSNKEIKKCKVLSTSNSASKLSVLETTKRTINFQLVLESGVTLGISMLRNRTSYYCFSSQNILDVVSDSVYLQRKYYL